MHRNAPLTPQGRLRLCQMIEEGWTVLIIEPDQVPDGWEAWAQ
jgi:hypothetical protein